MDKSSIVQSLRAIANKIERNQPLTSDDSRSLHASAVNADKHFTLEGMLKRDDVMSRAAFDKLPDLEKTTFMRSGGVLVDVPTKKAATLE